MTACRTAGYIARLFYPLNPFGKRGIEIVILYYNLR